MSKNVIHNFNLSIQNSADIKSSEELTQTIIKELAKVSKEMSQQKDIVQEWQEQKNQNTVVFANNSSSSTEGGTIDTRAKTSEKTLSIGTTSSVFGGTINNVAFSGATSTSNALIGEGVADNIGRKTINSTASDNITSPTSGAGNNMLNFSNSITTQTYANVAAQQTLAVPQMLQANSSEPSIEVIKAEIKKKLDAAVSANDIESINYWKNISKAFDERATAQDFDGKPGNELFTQMYTALKQSYSAGIENQNFNWEIVREKMIKSIVTNILSGTISVESKKRWTIIQQQLKNNKVNIANLFEQYGELFLLLKEVEGLNALPNTITITTKTKIYPNLSALYPAIGKEDVYVFLKGISDMRGSAVDKGAVKIKNTVATSFIVGESLEFTLDEAFIKQKQFQKENINWIVYHVGNKQESIFRDKGTSLTYNFDKAGTYRIDAYGNRHTVKGNIKAPGSTFIELKIEAQEITIVPPAIIKNGLTRTSTKEQLFKVALKYPKVKTLNPLKFYYQVETKTGNKVIILSEEQELDSTGVVKFSMPNLGDYCIKVTSKDQYALNKEYKINAIKNEVTSIGQVGKASNIGRFLSGVSNNNLTLEVKNFRINPATDEEKEDVKWIIYDANNKPYLPPGSVVMADNNNPKKRHLHKWSSFDVPLPKKEGNYTVEAYNDTMQGVKAKSVFNIEITRPQITEAYWASGGGSKKNISGFEGESNWIKANIPYYNNQTVRIYFYLNTIKTKYYLDTKTNENGEIFQEIKFDSDFQKQIGFENNKNAKIGFKVLGIQNGKPYPFKAPTNYESNTVLSVTTDIKILDAYFMYDDKRVTSQDQITFDKNGTTLTIVAKTQNMVGKEVVLTAHKVEEKPVFRHRVIVNSEGVAITKFDIVPAKGLKNGTVNKYYVGIEGYSTKHLTDKMINMVVGSNLKNKLATGIYKSHFDDNVDHIFDVEGGYVDDKNDRGGKTNMGIIYDTYKNFYKVYGDGTEKTEKDHQNLSITEAKKIYKIEFWNKIHGDEIYNASIALYIFDFAIHSGVYNATKIVQETLKNDFQINISVDGGFGTGTLNNVNRVDSKIFYQKLDQNRRKFVENIIKNDPSQKKYEKGWENRLKKLEYKKEEFNINQKIESWLKKDYKNSPVKDKNSSIANLILEAHALNLVEFNSEGAIGVFDSGLGGTQDTFIKIRDGKEIGNEYGDARPKTKFDPAVEDIPVIETALKIIQSNVKNWVDNNYKPKEPNKLNLGSFMVWNNSGKNRIAGALRPTKHGNKASAIDFNLSTFSNKKIDFSKPEAEKMVLEIIQRLPKDNYGFGFPKQGNFFPINNRLVNHSTYYEGIYNKAFTQLKSEAIKKELEKRMGDNTIIVFPDFENHLHIQLE